MIRHLGPQEEILSNQHGKIDTIDISQILSESEQFWWTVDTIIKSEQWLNDFGGIHIERALDKSEWNK